MLTKIKQNVDPNFDERFVEAKGWKNLVFLKDGRSYLGICVHPSRELAKTLSDEYDAASDVKNKRAKTRGGRLIINMLAGWKHPWDDYSHTIQIPWNQ